MAMVRRSRQEWEAIVREHAASGKAAARFAAERGINKNTLVWWSFELVPRGFDDDALRRLVHDVGFSLAAVVRTAPRRLRTPGP